MFRYEDLIGRPYRKNAAGPEAYSCYGLVREVSRRMGNTLPDYDQVCLAAAIDSHKNDFASVSRPRIGDLVVIKTRPRERHIGIMVDGSRFIQCTRLSGTEVVGIGYPFYSNRIEGYYRYRGK